MLRPATVEVVVLPPVDTRDWTRENLDERIEAIRSAYLAVLGAGSGPPAEDPAP